MKGCGHVLAVVSFLSLFFLFVCLYSSQGNVTQEKTGHSMTGQRRDMYAIHTISVIPAQLSRNSARGILLLSR